LLLLVLVACYVWLHWRQIPSALVATLLFHFH
jgi:hypothetical protein